jgi:hypothetical protein
MTPKFLVLPFRNEGCPEELARLKAWERYNGAADSKGFEAEAGQPQKFGTVELSVYSTAKYSCCLPHKNLLRPNPERGPSVVAGAPEDDFWGAQVLPTAHKGLLYDIGELSRFSNSGTDGYKIACRHENPSRPSLQGLTHVVSKWHTKRLKLLPMYRCRTHQAPQEQQQPPQVKLLRS